MCLCVAVFTSKGKNRGGRLIGGVDRRWLTRKRRKSRSDIDSATEGPVGMENERFNVLVALLAKLMETGDESDKANSLTTSLHQAHVFIKPQKLHPED